MSWSCPKCGGLPARENVRRCVDCNFTEFGQLVLTSAAGVTIVANIDTEFGRESLAHVVDHDEVGATLLPPFSSKSPEMQWLAVGNLTPAPGAVNPTCVNGAPIGPEGHPLTGGETVSVGPQWAKLTASIR